MLLTLFNPFECVYVSFFVFIYLLVILFLNHQQFTSSKGVKCVEAFLVRVMRKGALLSGVLFSATFRAADQVQAARTVKFIQQKLKNECVETRVHVLEALACNEVSFAIKIPYTY